MQTTEHDLKRVEFVSNVYVVDGRKVIQCNIRDITERKLAEDRAQQINRDLVAMVSEPQRRDRETKWHNDMSELPQSCTTQQDAFEMLEFKAGEVFVGQNGCLVILKAAGQAHLALAVGGTTKLVLSNLRLRERLGERANRDSLTGLFNRRYLDDSLSRELSLSQRRNEPLSIVVLDVDHFKNFNDVFGHEAGYTAMRAIADVFLRNLRASGIACRFGGDEFALILPNLSLSDTQHRVGSGESSLHLRPDPEQSRWLSDRPQEPAEVPRA